MMMRTWGTIDIMWQYCNWCKTYYYKFGANCPHCWVYSLWANPVPGDEVQRRLTRLWDDRTVTTYELSTPAIAETHLQGNT